MKIQFSFSNARRLVMLAITGLLFATIVPRLAAAQIQPPRIRDSAGVQIVEHTTIKGLPPINLIDARPRLDIGGLKSNPAAELDPRQPFIGVARLSNGRLVATSMSELKIFEASGAFVRSIGRAGDGPGEFGQLRDVCVGRGDTILAINYNRGRVSVFSAAGAHIRTFAIAGYVADSPCFSDGSFLIRSNRRPNPASRFTAAEAAAFDDLSDGERIGLDGRSRGVIAAFADEAFAPFQTVGNSFVQGQFVYAGDGKSANIRIYSADGKLVRIIRWNDTPIPVTREMIDADIRRSVPNTATADEIVRRLERGRARPAMPTLPMYSSIFADPAARVWVQDPFTNPRPRGFTIFAPDGRLLGRMILPTIPGAEREAEVSGFLGNEVLLRWRDTDGAAHLTFHPLLPAPARRY